MVGKGIEAEELDCLWIIGLTEGKVGTICPYPIKGPVKRDLKGKVESICSRRSKGLCNPIQFYGRALF